MVFFLHVYVLDECHLRRVNVRITINSHSTLFLNRTPVFKTDANQMFSYYAPEWFHITRGVWINYPS